MFGLPKTFEALVKCSTTCQSRLRFQGHAEQMYSGATLSTLPETFSITAQPLDPCPTAEMTCRLDTQITDHDGTFKQQQELALCPASLHPKSLAALFLGMSSECRLHSSFKVQSVSIISLASSICSERSNFILNTQASKGTAKVVAWIELEDRSTWEIITVQMVYAGDLIRRKVIETHRTFVT